MKSGIKSDGTWNDSPSRLLGRSLWARAIGLGTKWSAKCFAPTRKLTRKLNHSYIYRSVLVAAMTIATHLTMSPLPVWAAERLTVRIGPIEQSIEVSDLERYVETGKLSDELEPFEPLLGDTLREALGSKLDIDPNIADGIIDDLLKTPAGDRLLKALLLALPDNTIEEIKAALELAIESANGLSLIGIFKAFPAENITVDVTGAIAVASRLNTPYWETQILSSVLKRELTVETSDTLPNFDPAAVGTFTPQEETLTFIDRGRQRRIEVDIYWGDVGVGLETKPLQRNRWSDPDTDQDADQDTDQPLVIMSHGFGSDRTFLNYLARHLASHGITVVSLEHPGSNREWLEELPVTINPSQLLPPQELIDRPLDITFVLDELEKLNQRSSARGLNLRANSPSRFKPTETPMEITLKATQLQSDSSDFSYEAGVFNPRRTLKSTETPMEITRRISQLTENVSLPSFNTNKVVAIGHSLGGYTVLALAGGELNFEHLQKYCQRRQVVGRAPADWLQCAAVSEELPNGQKKMKLRDDRMVGAIALNPVIGHIFGEKGLKQVKTPTLLLAGTNDPWAPAVTHQLRPFLDLPKPKYLITAIDGTHYSGTDPDSPNPMKTDSPFENEISETDSEAQRQLLRGVTLAFIRQETSQAKTYQPFLTATYAQSLSNDDLPLRLNREFSSRLTAWLKNREDIIGDIP
jgi:predicted dienelactone hydrolase